MKNRGQVTVETGILISAVVAGFVAMGLYLQRGYQGSLHANASSHGLPFDPRRPYSERSALTPSWDPKTKTSGPAFQQVQDVKIAFTLYVPSSGNLTNHQVPVEETFSAAVGGNAQPIPVDLQDTSDLPGGQMNTQTEVTTDWNTQRLTCYEDVAPCQ